MAIKEEYLQAYDWARQALEHMVRDGIAPTPENYALFYSYYSGADANLKMGMDFLLRQGGNLSQQQCVELYTAHLGLETEHRVLRQANAAIEAEIQKVMSVIDTANAGTESFGKTLDNFSGKLGDTASLDQIREVVNKVAAETRVITQQNERLHTQLAQTTDQLSEMRTNLDTVHRESQIDPLTEVGNRKFFDIEIRNAIQEATDTGAPLAMLLADIDHFKKFNDNYGHLVGDQVLRLVARTLVENLKGRDVIARYGGEEFVILLPHTRVGDSEKVANQLRGALGTKQIKRRSTNEMLGVVTISIGATEYVPGEDIESFIHRADSALYRAKQNGRNMVVSEMPGASSSPLAAPPQHEPLH